MWWRVPRPTRRGSRWKRCSPKSVRGRRRRRLPSRSTGAGPSPRPFRSRAGGAFSSTLTPAGRAARGASNLVFLFIVMSGFYLWWPRRWTRGSLRAVTWFRRMQTARARDFNWHNVVGFWSALPLFVVVLSAVVISYTWASNLVYRLAGEEPPAQQQRGGTPGGAGQQPQGTPPPAPLEGLDALLARAERQVEGWRSITTQLPQKPDVPVVFAIDRGNGGQPHLRSQLTL